MFGPFEYLALIQTDQRGFVVDFYNLEQMQIVLKCSAFLSHVSFGPNRISATDRKRPVRISVKILKYVFSIIYGIVIV